MTGWGLPLVLRASLRSGWRGLLGLAVLIGIGGGAVLTGLEASRRTDTAFERLEAETAAWDVLVNPDEGVGSALALEDIAGLPGVTRAGRVDGVFMSEAHVDSLRELDAGFIVLATDDMAVYEIGGPARIEGRLPDPEAANEVFVSARAAEINDFEVGDVFHGRLLTEADFERLEQAGAIDDAITLFNRDDFGELVDLDIVGIGTFFDEVVVDEGFNTGSMLVTPAFFQAYDQPTAGFWGAVVDLEPGVDVDDFRADVEALVPDETIAFQTRVAVEDQAERAIRPQVAALTVFTAVAALIGLVIVGQAVSRRLQFDAVAFAPLRALGLTERQRAALSLSRTAAAAVVGGLIAVVIAVAVSPIAPVGVARDAEPAPGLRMEWWVILGGAVIIVAVVVMLAVWPALRSVRPRPQGLSRAVASSWAAAAGLPPSLVAGTRFALDPGPSNVPTRSTLVGAATAVLLVVATLTFAASLDHFIDSPRLYGTPWDAVVTAESQGDVRAEDINRLVTSVGAPTEVTGYGMLTPGQVVLDGVSLPAMAVADSPKPISPTVLEGHGPTARGEVALGSATLEELGVEVGETVTVSRGDQSPATLEVVGRVVLPAVSAYPGADKTSLGEGALLTSSDLHDWSPEFSPEGVLLDVVGGTDVDALVASVDDPDDEYALLVDDPGLPSDVLSLERVRSTPLVLAGLLTALIALTVVHALSTAVRARRRDLAVLRTFGFTRRQVLGAVALQATLIAAVGLVVGIPLGIVAGRLAWTEVVDRLGGQVDRVVPIIALGLVAVGVLVLANLVSLVPGLRAARTPTASILRTE